VPDACALPGQTALVGLYICPVWFLAQCTYNASLDWTSVSSSTILSTVSGYELMSTCRSHADCWLTQQYPRQAVHVCTLHRVSEREVPLLEARWGGCNVRGPPIGCSMRIPVSHPALYSYCCVPALRALCLLACLTKKTLPMARTRSGEMRLRYFQPSGTCGVICAALYCLYSPVRHD